MERARAVRLLAAAGLLAGALAVQGAHAGPGSGYCAGTYDTAKRVAAPLRFGVDPGVAGNPLPGGTVKPVDLAKERRALRGLRSPHHRLVVRLNRLFWSDGEPALRAFTRRARALARDGFDVEVQVRYHPPAEQDGDLSAWQRWVRHVVDVLAANPHVVGLTITNEVNLTVSSNTSDGSYSNAKDALIRGIEAAHDQLTRLHDEHRVRLGFTFAYRFDPRADAAFWRYLHNHGGSRFRRALGFVGLDDYPGTFYPPVLVPGSPTGSSPGQALAEAAATMRRCYLPMGAIPARVPLWVTENGYPTRAGRSGEAAQAAALAQMVTATHAVAKTYGITDYRWFNLRDNDSQGTGMFDTDGLLRDDYSPKPAYASLRDLVERYATRTRR